MCVWSGQKHLIFILKIYIYNIVINIQATKLITQCEPFNSYMERLWAEFHSVINNSGNWLWFLILFFIELPNKNQVKHKLENAVCIWNRNKKCSMFLGASELQRACLAVDSVYVPLREPTVCFTRSKKKPLLVDWPPHTSNYSAPSKTVAIILSFSFLVRERFKSWSQSENRKPCFLLFFLDLQ